MPLKRARPVDEVIEIAGEDYDYDDLGGRDERRARRRKRQASRKASRSRRLKKDAGRLRQESRASGTRRKKKTRSASSAEAAQAPSSASSPSARSYEEYEEEYEDEYPDEAYDPEDFEDPYEDAFEDEEYDEDFEGEFSGKKKGLLKRRKARTGARKDWTRPALVGKLRIHAQKGHRAAIRELEPGLYLVAEVSQGEMDTLKRLREAELAGGGDPELGALGILARLASTRAVQALRRSEPAPTVMPAAAPLLPTTEPAHPWYDKSRVPPGVGGAVVTQAGDSMWSIASKHLGAGLKWNQLYLLNASQLQGRKPTDPLPAGMVLWLPAGPTGTWLNT